MKSETVAKMVHLYEVDRLNTRQIGAIVGVSNHTVGTHLRRAGVIMRCKGYETTPNLDNPEWLRDQYVTQGKKVRDIAKEIGCAPCTVVRWMGIHGIEGRIRGQAPGFVVSEETREKQRLARRGRFQGADNPNWKGGQPNHDRERNRYPSKMWVKAVKDRDGWTCVECGSTGKVHAHHIKRWRDHPELRYDVSNGVTLCEECHERAHGRGFKFPWNRHADISTSAPPLPTAG